MGIKFDPKLPNIIKDLTKEAGKVVQQAEKVVGAVTRDAYQAAKKVEAGWKSFSPPAPGFHVDAQSAIDWINQKAKDLGLPTLKDVQAITSEYDIPLSFATGMKGVVLTGTTWLQQHLPGAFSDKLSQVIDHVFNTPPARPDFPTPPPEVMPDPSLPTKKPEGWTGKWPMTYEPTTGPLWDPAKGPQVPAEVRQGMLGDCYFMASMAGLSADQVSQMINDNHDGTYTVRLYDVDETGKTSPVFVRVTGDLPDPACAQYDANSKWAAIVEKAYAAHVGSYNTASGDDNPKFFAAPSALSGRTTVAYLLEASGPDVVYQRLAQAVADHRPVFTGFYSENQKGLFGGHAYTVVGVRTDEQGNRFVTLRNPWGSGDVQDANGKPRDGVDDGVFELPLEEYMSTYQAVAIAGG